MKKIFVLGALILGTSLNAFANIAPAERITLTGKVIPQITGDVSNLQLGTGYNGASSNFLNSMPTTTAPVQISYDVNTPITFGFGGILGSDPNTAKQLYCTYNILTTKNADGTYNTQITVSNQGPHVTCQVTPASGGSDYSPTFLISTY